MVVDDVIDCVVANLNRVIRLPHVRRTVAWRGYERMDKSLVDGFIYVGDQFISCNRVEQVLFNVRNGAIQFVNERRTYVKRVLFAEPRDVPSGFSATARGCSAECRFRIDRLPCSVRPRRGR